MKIALIIIGIIVGLVLLWCLWPLIIVSGLGVLLIYSGNVVGIVLGAILVIAGISIMFPWFHVLTDPHVV